MALELRPNCEFCDRDLPPDAGDAMICTYECTFCATCVAEVLYNVCPNCGGGFAPRPIRPRGEYVKGLSLATRPGATERVHMSKTEAWMRALSERLRDVAPQDR